MRFMISQVFLNTCGESVRVDPYSESIQAYDPINADNSKLISSVQHLNLGSIAKVCDTDLFSVELVIKEMLA